ncbi:MAG: glycerol-3-phosphate 1-O-acyltransferase PlsY [Planctomycetota bacterium]
MDSALLVYLLAAFLFGSVPFGLLLVRVLLGKDIRKIGSGNIGATNVARCFQPRVRVLVFFVIWLFDMGKGYLPVQLLPSSEHVAANLQGCLLGTAAIAGHCFSPFLGFKGGKGVSTVCGVLLALDPLALLMGMIMFVVVLAWTRIMAVSSISLGFAIALSVMLRDPATAFGDRRAISWMAILLAFFLVWTHRQNIRGLLRVRRIKENSR